MNSTLLYVGLSLIALSACSSTEPSSSQANAQTPYRECVTTTGSRLCQRESFNEKAATPENAGSERDFLNIGVTPAGVTPRKGAGS